MKLTEILERAVREGASDILLIAGLPVTYKINGELRREGERLPAQETGALAEDLYRLADRDITSFRNTGDDDFSFAIPGLSRFRVSAYKQRGALYLP